jgi:hypothetical protein
MIQCINVGDDNYDPDVDQCPDGTTHVVYKYESGEYEGIGTAIAIAGDRLFEKSLSHCSCCRPWNDPWDPITRENLFDDSCMNDIDAEVVAKVREILGA